MDRTTVQYDGITTAGLRAVVLMTDMGHHCGYVGVPAGHPLHGANYNDPCAALQPPPQDAPVGKRSMLAVFCAAGDDGRMNSPEMVFDVHGGITYSGGSSDYPAPSDGLWWFGYDCGHAGDSPSPDFVASRRASGRHRYEGIPGSEFRDLPYCIAECESLAAQIVQATGSAA